MELDGLARHLKVAAFALALPFVAISPASAENSPTAEKQSQKEIRFSRQYPQWEESKSLTGTVEAGQRFYLEKTYGNDLTCVTCHSHDPDDTMEEDGDGYVRAGSPIYAAQFRTNIKNTGTSLVTLGSNQCVIHFMKGPQKGMNAQDMADLDKFLKSEGDPSHPTAANLDYRHQQATIPDVLTGGDPAAGSAVAAKTCLVCHDVDGVTSEYIDTLGELKPGLYGFYGRSDIFDLAHKVRNPGYQTNVVMPSFIDSRMSEKDLIDLLAWLTTRPEDVQ